MPHLTTHPTDEELAAFALGKPAPAGDLWVEEHVAECEECQRRAAAVAPDDLLVLLSTARGRLAVDQATVVTPHPSTGDTPSAFAPTQGWNGIAPVPTDEEVPDSLVSHPKYRVLRRIGAGGMGTVWLAEHAVMDRPVAVKVIRSELLARPGAAGRFLREVRAAAKLDHANIVRAHDAEQVGSSCLFVMEFVDGETLAERVKSGPLPVAEACRAIRDAARGLAHAHAAGLVHRDVKPHNLIRAADGTVKVLDFGLAGVVAGEAVAATGDGLTGAGMIAGTPDYIAPEQIRDPHAADARADVYGLGCTLYHLLAGRPPFANRPVAEKLAAQESRMPDPIPDLTVDLAAILAKMLAKRPEDRYQSAAEVAAALDALAAKAEGREPKPEPKARTRRWWACANPWALAASLLFALVVLAGSVVFKIQRDNEEITIDTDDPDVEVVMKRKGEVLRVIDRKSGQTWEIDTLTNQIGLADTPDGLRFELPEGSSVVMKRKGDRDGKPVFKVARVAKPGPGLSDGELILGAWEVVAAEADGESAPQALINSLKPTITFTAEKFTARPGGAIPKEFLKAADVGLLRKEVLAVMEKGIEGVYRLDPSKTPKAIDLTVLGDDLRRGALGIYSLDGNVLKVCLALNPEKVAERPSEFSSKSKGGAPRAVVTLKRRSPEPVGEVRQFKGPDQTTIRSAITPDGKFVAVSYGNTYHNRIWTEPPGKDYSIRLFEIATGREVRKFSGHTEGAVGLAFSNDGKYLLSGAHDTTLRLWDADTGKELKKFEGHTGFVRYVALSPDNKYALSASHDKTVRLWNVETGKEERQFLEHTGVLESATFSSDGKHVLFNGGDSSVVFLCETETGKEVRRFEGHTAWVGAARFSPDGLYVATASNDGTVRLWDADTGKELARFAHGKLVLTVAFTPDGTRLVSGGTDNCVRVWDVASRKQIHAFSGHTEEVFGLSITPNGRYAVSTSPDSTARLWRLPDPEPETFGEVRRFAGHNGWATRVVFSLDGRRVISSGDVTRVWNAATGEQAAKYDITRGGWAVTLSPDGRRLLCSDVNDVHLLDLEAGREVHVLKGHTAVVWAAAFLPDGKRAVTGGQDATLREWDLEKGEEIRQFEGVKEGIRCMSLSPDGTKLAVGHFINRDIAGSNLRVWDVKSGKEARAAIPLPYVIFAVAFTRDGKRVITGDRDGRVRLWDIETGEELWRSERHAGPVEGVAFTPDGRVVSSGGTGDGTLRLWDPKTGKQLHLFAGPAEGLLGLAVSADGRFAATGGKDELIRLWRLPPPPLEEKCCELRRFDGGKDDGVWSVGFSPDGNRVLKGGGTHVVLYDRATGENIVSIRHGCWSAVLSPDGKQILTATHEGKLYLWDAKTGEQQKLNVPQLGRVRNAVFSPDGKLFASSHADGFVHLWDAPTAQEIQKFPAFHHAIRSAAFRPGTDQILVVRGDLHKSDKTLCLYDVKTGNEVRTLEGHTDQIFDVAISADGRRALSCGWDKTVRLWDLDTGKQLLCLEGHTDFVATVAFCPDGRRAVSGGLDKVLRFWDLETGKAIRSFEGHTGHIISVAVSSDGRFAASGSCDDKTVRLWRLPDPPAKP